MRRCLCFLRVGNDVSMHMHTSPFFSAGDTLDSLAVATGTTVHNLRSMNKYVHVCFASLSK